MVKIQVRKKIVPAWFFFAFVGLAVGMESVGKVLVQGQHVIHLFPLSSLLGVIVGILTHPLWNIESHYGNHTLYY